MYVSIREFYLRAVINSLYFSWCFFSEHLPTKESEHVVNKEANVTTKGKIILNKARNHVTRERERERSFW